MAIGTKRKDKMAVAATESPAGPGDASASCHFGKTAGGAALSDKNMVGHPGRFAPDNSWSIRSGALSPWLPRSQPAFACPFDKGQLLARCLACHETLATKHKSHLTAMLSAHLRNDGVPLLNQMATCLVTSSISLPFETGLCLFSSSSSSLNTAATLTRTDG